MSDEEQEGSPSSPSSSSRTSPHHHYHDCVEYAPILPSEQPPPDDGDVPASGVGASTTVFWLLSDEESSSSASPPPSSSLVSSPGRVLESFCRTLMSSPFWQHHSFWMGSLLLVIAATLNLVNTWMDEYYYDDDDENDDKGNANSNGSNAMDDERFVGTNDPLACWDAYKGLMVGGSFLYLLDSVLHIRSKYHSSNHPIQATADGTDHSTLSSSSSLSFLGRMFRTDDEDDTSLWFACIFGVASAFDLCSSFLQDDDYPWPAYVFECLSVYLFGMSANFLLYTKRDHYLKHQPCCNCSLMGWGDAFYWIGCTTDIVVSVLDNPTNQEHYGWWNAIGCMASALFWFTDALLYECAGADIFDMEVLVPPEGGPQRPQRMIRVPHDEQHDDDDEAPETYSRIQEEDAMDDLFITLRQQE